MKPIVKKEVDPEAVLPAIVEWLGVYGPAPLRDLQRGQGEKGEHLKSWLRLHVGSRITLSQIAKAIDRGICDSVLCQSRESQNSPIFCPCRQNSTRRATHELLVGVAVKNRCQAAKNHPLSGCHGCHKTMF